MDVSELVLAMARQYYLWMDVKTQEDILSDTGSCGSAIGSASCKKRKFYVGSNNNNVDNRIKWGFAPPNKVQILHKNVLPPFVKHLTM